MADVGPDRAAAEWILRLGGQVKFGSFDSWTTDYNRMPAEPRERTRLEAINASGISITNNGLEHLGWYIYIHRRLCDTYLDIHEFGQIRSCTHCITVVFLE